MYVLHSWGVRFRLAMRQASRIQPSRSASQKMIELSSPTDARIPSRGLNTTPWTAFCCVARVPSSSWVFTSQSRISPSALPDARILPSPLKATPETAWVWPYRTGGIGCQLRTLQMVTE